MSVHQHRRPSRFAAVVSAGVICVSVFTIAGCGGSSSSDGGAPKQTARQTPQQSNPDVGQAAVQQSPSSRPTSQSHRPNSGSVQRSAATGRSPAEQKPSSATRDPSAGRVYPTGRIQKARPPAPGTPADDGVPTTGKALNPCHLVSRSEAQSITGLPLAASVQAPLGPTCIYQFSGSTANITITIETLSLAQVTHHLQQKKEVSVGDRKGYCGRLGEGMLFVPLPAGHVLNVTAPCSVAQRFAIMVLSRLAA